MEQRRAQLSSNSSSGSSLDTLPDVHTRYGTLEYFESFILSPLHRACAINDCEKILEFIKEGMELNLCDNRGYSALHYACKYERVEAVKILVEQPLIQLDIQNNKNKTPLHLAANYNKTPAILKLLIEAGCDVNIQYRSDHTALHYIIRNSNDFSVKVKMGSLVLENGFDLTRVDNFNLLKLILKRPDSIKWDDEEFPELQDYLNFISMFLYYNIDVNCQQHDEKGYVTTPFQFLLGENRINAVIDLFLDYVDDFNFDFDDSIYRRFTMHGSYLMLAIKCEYPRVLDMVNRGANINVTMMIGGCLENTLVCKNNQLFKYFWTHCNLDEVLESNGMLLYDVIRFTKNFPSEDYLETIYIILSSKYALQMLDWSVKNGLYLDLVEEFSARGYSQEDRLKVLYTILSITNEITVRDLEFIYYTYGFNEEFEAFLIVNARIFTDRSDTYDYSNRFFYIINPQLILSYSHFPLTLKELSRDAFRINFKLKFLDSESVCPDFYTKIQSMCIPKKIKDIIVLKEHLSEV